MAVHASVTPDGFVLIWDREVPFDGDGLAEAKVWVPDTGQLVPVPVPNDRDRANNIFCAGHSFLEDGKLLVTGGHIRSYKGLPYINIFNWQQGGWFSKGVEHPLPDMNPTLDNEGRYLAGRWYPTNVPLR